MQTFFLKQGDKLNLVASFLRLDSFGFRKFAFQLAVDFDCVTLAALHQVGSKCKAKESAEEADAFYLAPIRFDLNAGVDFQFIVV